ncbi:anti-sigma-F factor Fin [Thalassobacillus hwangdonensis]|uniref:Anti-sigma-F factor Fin n=1 Tax=Thalassobacillus hwangdonensis TaxID=546108 RepID=A0ABW3L6N3_9BACI
MAIIYVCRHCSRTVGELDQRTVDETMLGLDRLTEQERMEMIDLKQNGDLEVQTICDDCQNAYNLNPQYHETDFLIQ